MRRMKMQFGLIWLLGAISIACVVFALIRTHYRQDVEGGVVYAQILRRTEWKLSIDEKLYAKAIDSSDSFYENQDGSADVWGRCSITDSRVDGSVNLQGRRRRGRSELVVVNDESDIDQHPFKDVYFVSGRITRGLSEPCEYHFEISYALSVGPYLNSNSERLQNGQSINGTLHKDIQASSNVVFLAIPIDEEYLAIITFDFS